MSIIELPLSQLTYLSTEELAEYARIVERNGKDNEITELQQAMLSFDYTYEYSDSAQKWRSGKAREEEIIEMINSSDGLKEADKGILIKTLKGLGHQPIMQVWPDLDAKLKWEKACKGYGKGKLHYAINGITDEDLETLRQFHEELARVILMDDPLGGTIWSPKAPNPRTLTNKVKVTDKAQLAYNKLFQKYDNNLLKKFHSFYSRVDVEVDGAVYVIDNRRSIFFSNFDDGADCEKGFVSYYLHLKTEDGFQEYRNMSVYLDVK